MSKLIITDVSMGKSYEFSDGKEGYAAAQNKLEQLNQAGHQVDLSTNNTGKRLQENEDSRSSFLGRLFG